jgi:hypothetical protein
MNADDRAGWDSGTPRRMLGMKAWQVVLLALMAVMDCLVIVVGLAIVLGPLLMGGGAEADAAALPSSPADETGPAPSPSQTPITMVFQFPTFTPYGAPLESPTPTRENWMEGWVKVAVSEVEMWMPGTYAAGDPHTEADSIIAALQDEGANYNWDFLREQMTGVDGTYVLWGIDSRQGNPAIITNVAVIYDRISSDQSLSEYANAFLSENADAFTLIKREPFAHPAYEAERLVLGDIEAEEIPKRYVLYAVRDGGFVWNFFCATALEEITDRLPEFDQMAGSFHILAAPE